MKPQTSRVSEAPPSEATDPPDGGEGWERSSGEAIYQSLLAKYTEKANSLNRQLRWFSIVRLLLFVGFIILRL